jgi:beta-galactosidase
MLDFKVEGPGEIVATDNGDPTNLVAFPSHQRAAFNGLCLAIIRAPKGKTGEIKIIVSSTGLTADTTTITAGPERRP